MWFLVKYSSYVILVWLNRYEKCLYYYCLSLLWQFRRHINYTTKRQHMTHFVFWCSLPAPPQSWWCTVEWRRYLDDVQVLFAPLCCKALHAAVLLALCVGMMHGAPRATDELARIQRAWHRLDLQGFPQRAAVTGRVHHHGFCTWVNLRLHHGDLQDVWHWLLIPWGPWAGFWDELGSCFTTAEDGWWMVRSAKGDLGDSSTLSDDWLLWWKGK